MLLAAARRTYAAPSSGRDDYIFSEVDHRQGLSHSSVICIYKDDSELMWFGTYDGVNCFDGKQMETFRTDFSQARSQSLGNNVIFGIAKADGDNLWISTRFSVVRFSRADRAVVANYGVSPDACLRSDSRGDTWLVDTDSVSFYNTRRGRFEGLERLGLHLSDPASHSFVTRDGELWLFPDSDAGDLYKIAVDGFDREAGPATPTVSKQRFHHKPVESLFYHDDTSFCFIDSDKNLYIYDVWRQTKVFIRNIDSLLARYGPIVGIVPFYEDFVIAFRTNGLVRLKATNLMMQRLSPNFTRQVRSVMTDSDGGLWVGTKGDGLIHIRDYAEGMDPDKTSVYYAESRQSARNYVRENTEFQVFSLKQSRFMDGFWIGSGPSGIYYRMNDDTRLCRLELPSGPQIEEVHAFHEADDTTLYVAAARGGLHRLTLDRSNGRLRVKDRRQFRFFHEQQELNTFFSMISEGDSVLWLGSRERGLVRFETATCNYYVYSLRELLDRPVDDVLCIARTCDGALLAGTTAGMVSLRFDGRKVVEARYVGREEGLLNDMIHGIGEDADGCLWLSTNKGLIKYNPATVSSHTYYYSGGVQIGEFCDDAYYRCPYTGRLFFGGVDGLLYVDRGGSVGHEYYPDILLRGVSFGRAAADLSDFHASGELRFRYTDEEVALKFAVPDYISGSRIEYSWMLEARQGVVAFRVVVRGLLSRSARGQLSFQDTLPQGYLRYRFQESRHSRACLAAVVPDFRGTHGVRRARRCDGVGGRRAVPPRGPSTSFAREIAALRACGQVGSADGGGRARPRVRRGTDRRLPYLRVAAERESDRRPTVAGGGSGARDRSVVAVALWSVRPFGESKNPPPSRRPAFYRCGERLR